MTDDAEFEVVSQMLLHMEANKLEVLMPDNAVYVTSSD